MAEEIIYRSHTSARLPERRKRFESDNSEVRVERLCRWTRDDREQDEQWQGK